MVIFSNILNKIRLLNSLLLTLVVLFSGLDLDIRWRFERSNKKFAERRVNGVEIVTRESLVVERWV